MNRWTVVVSMHEGECLFSPTCDWSNLAAQYGFHPGTIGQPVPGIHLQEVPVPLTRQSFFKMRLCLLILFGMSGTRAYPWHAYILHQIINTTQTIGYTNSGKFSVKIASRITKRYGDAMKPYRLEDYDFATLAKADINYPAAELRGIDRTDNLEQC